MHSSGSGFFCRTGFMAAASTSLTKRFFTSSFRLSGFRGIAGSSSAATASSTDHNYDFDLAVIGGGPSGFAAATRAWDLGKRVLIVNKGPIWGSGVTNGALSSKIMWCALENYC